ncbi:GDP-L-galactose phosphorylase 1-like isoform X2 [Camellia sinensis]|uniref:GDP-L-galactose phosphorylase 1-like isoform X2 n=1 Tax=Camellia sinensis TaxID=4442 RepID=UPI001035E331|nr:GDP-L-galactose phosphorylase 1-like isoform X2 [Camellia sinensis]
MFMQLGAKLPLYAFKRVNKIVGEKGLIALDYIEPSIAFLDSLLLGEWEDRMQRGLFRYDVTACETKVIPGEYGFIAQLNEGRHLKKRPTKFRVDKVLQPFDGNKFNFTKVGQEEVLFQFEASDEDNETQFFPNAPIDVENSPSVVAINVSPIEYGHVLLIPWILECLPQRIDKVSFLLALYMAAEAGNPYFRLGYNSLGAFATINHLHFQEIMHDPQVAADGFTYEGDALRGWLENGRETSPMTNLRLDHLHLTPNHALRLAIQDWLCKV